MGSIKFRDSDGNNLDISVIGYFKIAELEKEYIMYAAVDDNLDNEDGHVLLGEVVKEGTDVQILGILPEEEEIVVAYYNEISKQIGDE